MLKLTNVLDRISLIVIDATIVLFTIAAALFSGNMTAVVLFAVAKAYMDFYKDYAKKCLSVTVR